MHAPLRWALRLGPFLVALLLGALSAAGASPASAPRQPFLVDLHLHGSLSEGSATMAHHSAEAERLGYDGLWWSDHMSRQMAGTYLNAVGFEDSLQQQNGNWFLSEFQLEEDLPSSCHLEFQHDDPPQGGAYLRASHAVPSGAGWSESRLVFQNTQRFHHRSLISRPVVKLRLRLDSLGGNSVFLVRVRLSSRADGLSPEGVVNTLEYHPGSMHPPAPAPNVQQIPLQGFDPDLWNEVVLPVGQDAVGRFWEGEDQALTGVELVLLAKRGKQISMDIDDFRIELAGPVDLPVFQAQEQILASRHSTSLFHHVGMEVDGPVQQPVLAISTRDHLIALYPAGIPALIDYRDPGSLPELYPASGVDAVHAAGGVAILAHIFGALTDSGVKPDAQARQLVLRLLQNQAWGADAIEVGYPFRQRPLADFLFVWDQLSARGIYLTGIGSSDDHDVLPWDLRQNRWASLVRSTGSTASELLTAIRGGQVVFGDPTAFAPDGDLLFEQLGGAYSMGDVVPTAGGQQQLHVVVTGAQAGDELVLLRNAAEVQRLPFTGATLDAVLSQEVAAGDWLRLEIRDAADAAFLLSNPIYYIDPQGTPPPDRAPGP